MHRSGTSALAGVLGHMGADLPQDLMAPTEINPKGFFESNRITGLNEELLASGKRRWFDFKGLSQDWYASPKAAEFAISAQEALEAEFGRSYLFALKDPRICRLLPFWKPALKLAGCVPAFVCVHRHPHDVAASLQHWANYETDYSLLLWLRHVLDAEAGSRGETRVFVSYDMLLADWRQAVTRISKGLSLHWPVNPDSAAPAITEFLSDTLRHFRASGGEAQQNPMLEGWVGEVHAILERWAASGESNADHARLDAIRAAMQEAEPMLDPLLRDNQQQRLEAQALLRRIKELEAALHSKHLEAVSHQTTYATEQKMRGEAEVRITELTQTLDQSRAEAAGHQASHAAEQEQREAVEMQRAELARALDAAQAVATEQAAALAQAMAEAGQAAQAQAEGTARLAELTAQLDQSRAEAASHQANHAAEQEQREAVELQRAELARALDAAQAVATEQAAALAQAMAEAGQAAQAQAEGAARLAELTALLDQSRAEAAGHQANHAAEQEQREAVELQRAELTRALDAAQAVATEQAAALAQAMAEAEQAAQAQAEGTARLAELNALLDQSRAEAASHQASHAAEQEQREAVELQRAELTRALDAAQAVATEQAAALAQAEFLVANQARALAIAEAEQATLLQIQARLEDDLQSSQAATMTALQEADQLHSALIQRGQETEDLHRQILADAAHITGLQTTLADLTRDHATLTRQAARDGRHLAAMTARLTVVMQRDLDRRLTGQTEQAAAARAAQEAEQLRHALTQREQDADQLRHALTQREQDAEVLKRQSAADAARIGVLETTLADLTRDHAALIGQAAQVAAARAAQEAEIHQQKQVAQERIAALETHVQALYNSNSWKLTSPLRRIAATLRRPGP